MRQASTILRIVGAWLLSGIAGALFALFKPAGWVCLDYWHCAALDGMAQALVCVAAAVLIAPRQVALAAVPPILAVAAFYPLWEYWGSLHDSCGPWPGWYSCPMEPVAAVLGLGLLLTYLVHVFPTSKARGVVLLSGAGLTALAWIAYGMFGFQPG